LPNIVRFDCFEVDLDSGQLRKRGAVVNLRDQCFQVLSLLLEHPGRVITREQLRQRLWRNEVFVDFDNNLNSVIARLREALSDSVDHPRFIETLPKRGYRFNGNVFVQPAAGEAPAHRDRMVVLPFANLTGDPTQEWLGDAITDEIITHLAALDPEHLAVIARTTAMQYKGTQKDVARIGRELRVDYVLEGGVSRSCGRIGISVQVIRVSDQMHTFARKYEGEPGDIFGMQASIAESVGAHMPTTAVNIRPRWPGRQTAGKPTNDITAYNAYIQGRYFAERGTRESTVKAMQLYLDAVKRDPDFALAHMALADLYSWMGYGGYLRPRDAFASGITHALRAVDRDASLAEAHAVLAQYHKQLDYDWVAAEREMSKALALSPASPYVKFRHAVTILMPHKRINEAVAEIMSALESDPLASFTRAWLGFLLLYARDYNRAIDEARDLLELEPGSCWPHFLTGIAYRQKYVDTLVAGHPRPDFAVEAISEHLKAHKLAPGTDFFLGWLGLTLGICGRKTEAHAVLEQLQRSERYILPTSFAHVYLGLGETDAAFEWLARAVDERDQMLMPILSYPHYDPIRDDARFTALLRRMNLES
jgi:TolB-like protein/tetratricopeptide (TPR) repeat protein